MSGSSAGMSGSADDTEVRVSFFTRRAELVIPDTPVAVPGRLRRAALSALVNHLLQLGELLTSAALFLRAPVCACPSMCVCVCVCGSMRLCVFDAWSLSVLVYKPCHTHHC